MVSSNIGKAILFMSLISGCSIEKQAQEAKALETSAKTFCSISFFSIGYGIDVQSLKTVQNWAEEKKDSLILQQTPWGREGEIDLCFATKHSQNETERWLDELKELLAKAKNCRIGTEKACRK